MAELRKLIQAGSYEDLLSQTSLILAVDPGNSSALVYRGRALACLSRYEEASQVLELALQVRVCPQVEASVRELAKYCRRISAAVQEFEQFSKRTAAIPSSWYKERLLDVAGREEVSLGSGGYTDLDQRLKELGRDSTCVFVCKHPRSLSSLTEIDTGISRAIRNPLHDYPLTQADYEGFIYLKAQTYPLRWRTLLYDGVWTGLCEQTHPAPAFLFPTVNWAMRGKYQQPDYRCDVFFSQDAVESTAHRLLKWSLDRLANQRPDFFVPQYHNIIDPNLTAVLEAGTEVYRWRATDFLVEEREVPREGVVVALQGCVRRALGRGLPWHSVELVLTYMGEFLSVPIAHLASPLPDLPVAGNRELGVAIAGILSAALPLIAKLRKPALLLPGPLQAVVKAQRIYLSPGEEYSGVWHYDGLHEDIVAVVLYYYRYSSELQGGELEFISRRPRDQVFWLGETHNVGVKDVLEELPRCRVPLKQGSLVVFSNYQLVHRVLRMTNPSSIPASRDFLVLFLVDQRSPLPSTQSLPPQFPLQASESVRRALFLAQLQPAGQFGVSDSLVYSTGNGSCALVGWMERNDKHAAIWEDSEEEEGKPLACLEAFSRLPPLHRGLSWVLDEEEVEDISI